MVSLSSSPAEKTSFITPQRDKTITGKKENLSKIAQGLAGNNLGQGYVFMKKAWNENTRAHTK